MLENQFIQIKWPSFEVAKQLKSLPVYIGEDGLGELFTTGNIEEVDVEYGNANEAVIQGDFGSHIHVFGRSEVEGAEDVVLSDVDQDITVGERFYLATIGDEGTLWSQPLIRVDYPMSYVRYRCHEDAFGFPFHSAGDKWAGMYLPIVLSAPQNVQDSKTYEKLDGEVVTLYAKYYKEWEGTTEYLSEEMHDKILAALSCDEVYIDDKRVTLSNTYQVDWAKYELDCDGRTKLARATFKVREHITQRNSNY